FGVPKGVDVSRVVMLEPSLLTLENVSITLAGALEELARVLPDPCIEWLAEEEPRVLHGPSLLRLQQLQETCELYADTMAAIREDDADYHGLNHRWRPWFQNVFVDYY
ncbi:hypothetical protein CYMTET_50412, partial [Cymbomonas tetramitiformis]